MFTLMCLNVTKIYATYAPRLICYHNTSLPIKLKISLLIPSSQRKKLFCGSGGCKKIIKDITPCSPLKVSRRFGEMSTPSSETKSKPRKIPALCNTLL
jgi:hypothetical protein